MKTEQLIAILSRAAVSAAPVPTVFGRALVPGLLLGLAFLMLALGLRPDLMDALVSPMAAAKLVLPLLTGIVASVMLIRLARPGAEIGTGPKMLRLLGLVAAALVALTLLTTPQGIWMDLFMGTFVQVCLINIPLISLPILAAMLITLRHGAPLDALRAGLVAGLAAGGFGAAIYALHCPEDSPLFYVAWYGLAMAMVTALGGLVGRWALRW